MKGISCKFSLHVGFLQSITLIGFLSFLSKQVSQSTSDFASKYAFKFLLYSSLQWGHPTEFIFTDKSFNPTSLKNWTAKDITSASIDGSSLPKASIPNWWNCLCLPACGLSYLKHGVM